MKRLGFIIEKISLFGSLGLFSLMILMVTTQIIMRNIVGKSITAIEELVIILLTWLAATASVYALQKKSHVSVDYFVGKFSINKQKYIYIITCALLTVVCTFTGYYGLTLAKKQMIIPLAVTGWPRGILYLALPVGYFPMALVFIENIYFTLKGEDRYAIPTYEEEN